MLFYLGYLLDTLNLLGLNLLGGTLNLLGTLHLAPPGILFKKSVKHWDPKIQQVNRNRVTSRYIIFIVFIEKRVENMSVGQNIL